MFAGNGKWLWESEARKESNGSLDTFTETTSYESFRIYGHLFTLTGAINVI